MIEKSLLLTDSAFTTPPPDSDAAPKVLPGSDSLPKTSIGRWNQADLGYCDLHLDKIYRKSEIVLVRKDVYYKNVVFFIYCLQSLVIFQGAAFVKVNITTSLQYSILTCYTSELSNFDRNTLNNNLGVKS